MQAVDTNILVRFLVKDDLVQANQVYRLFKKAEQARSCLFVPLTVMLELIWVLESAYSIDRTSIVGAIADLLLMPVLKFEHHPALQEFVRSASGTDCDLSDMLIGCSARHQGCSSTLTFDKKASRSDLFELLG